ncbi:MAG: FapA family protein [Oscillospiraceae bacterium]
MAEEMVVHSQIQISINPNNSTAFVSFTKPSGGGLDVTVQQIMDALEDRYICHGVLENDIKKAVEEKRYDENICVAQWDPPVDGVDGTIKYFYKTDQAVRPVENEQGEVDYKNLGLVRNITAGTPIAEITFPTEGEPGTDIMGKPVPQKQGTPANYTVGAGTTLVNDDTQIVAAVDGNLVYKNNSFCVEETLLINGDVEVATGNIDFIGDVVVKGSVFEGFRVSSKRNITVNGTATDAELSAGGNISVKIGAINSTITCKGDVKLGFCENTAIECDGTVDSASFVGGEVFAGQKIIASGKGVMMGGKYTALDGVEASVIGSEKYAKTEITLGNNAVLSKERDTLEKSIAQMEDKVDQLGKVLTTLTEIQKKTKLPPEREQMKAEALRSRLKLQQEIKKATKRIEEIEDALKLTQNLSVVCKRMMYPGVTLRINNCILSVNAVQNRVRATVDGGEIVFRPV